MCDTLVTLGLGALADVSLEDSAERKLTRLHVAAKAMFEGYPSNVVAVASWRDGDSAT